MIHHGAEWFTPPGQSADPAKRRAYLISTPTEYSRVRLNQAVAARGARRVSREELLGAARRGLEQITAADSEERRIYGAVLDDLMAPPADGDDLSEEEAAQAEKAAAELSERFAHFADVLRRHFPRYAELEAIAGAFGAYHRLELVRLHVTGWRNVPSADKAVDPPAALGGELSDQALEIMPSDDLRAIEVQLLSRLILSRVDKKKSPQHSSGASSRKSSSTAKSSRRKRQPAKAKAGISRAPA